jgi:hypothetical protein
MSDTAPQVPSAWQLERAVSNWQQLRGIYASDPALADDEDAIVAALADAEITHPDVLLSRAIDAAMWIDLREIEADELRRQVTARRDRYRARAEAVRLVIADLMAALEKTSHRARFGLANIAAGRPSLVLTDEQQIPPEYFKTERTLMRTPLIADLDNGKVVPGAVLSNPVPVLRIRRL